MSQLEEIRERLDLCDKKIVSVLEERMDIIKEIMVYKKENGLPILQPEQEKRQRKMLLTHVDENTYKDEILDIFTYIVENSRRIQAKTLFTHNILLIGFMGAGKSTVSTYLSKILASPQVEMDEEIVKKEGMSINKIFEEYGETLEGAAEAIWQYNKGIIDATYDLIPAVKPQIAMYEQFGIPGLVAFKKTVDYAKEKDLVVIGDVKRGDIGSTSAAYATGHLGKVQVGSKTYSLFDEDFATVNPYLGTDGIKPFIDVCKEENKGLFILVKTSNPSSGEFQDRLIDGKPLYELVGEYVAKWGQEHMGDEYSYIGAVVGATYPEMGKVLRKIMPKSYILVPGYGAQGGTAEGLKPYFNEDGLGAIVNSSRGIICAYKQDKYAKFGELNYADASRQAVIDMIEDINSIF